MSDPLWVDDITILLNSDKFVEFFPRSDMTRAAKMNAITRFSIYASIVMYVYNRNINSFFFAVATMTIIFLLHHSNKTTGDIETFDEAAESREGGEDRCVKPTRDNPFMNVLLTDYENNPRRGEACKTYNDKETEAQMKKDFNYNLYRDVSNIFNRNNSQRQFYTNPGTSIPNRQGDFVNWLYNRPETCKEGNGERCIANVYPRVEGGSRLPVEMLS